MKIVTRILVSAAVVAAVVGAHAQTAKPAAAKCPACGMTLGSKMSKDTPLAVKDKKGKVVGYCCSHCKMKH